MGTLKKGDMIWIPFLRSLKWLWIDWNERPLSQSERFDNFKQYLHQFSNAVAYIHPMCLKKLDSKNDCRYFSSIYYQNFWGIV